MLCLSRNSVLLCYPKGLARPRSYKTPTLPFVTVIGCSYDMILCLDRKNSWDVEEAACMVRKGYDYGCDSEKRGGNSALSLMGRCFAVVIRAGLEVEREAGNA